MSLKSYLTVGTGVILLFAAAPAFAASSWPSVNLLASGTADNCASASAAAQANGNASEVDLSKCDLAVKFAVLDSGRAEALNNRSVLHFERAEYDAALADNTAALKLNDRMAEAIVNRGSIFLTEHRAKDAVANFDRALAFNPAHPEQVYFNRAMAREDLGDLNGAYADYTQAAQLDPQWDKPRVEMARFTIVRQKPMS